MIPVAPSVDPKYVSIMTHFTIRGWGGHLVCGMPVAPAGGRADMSGRLRGPPELHGFIAGSVELNRPLHSATTLPSGPGSVADLNPWPAWVLMWPYRLARTWLKTISCK